MGAAASLSGELPEACAAICALLATRAAAAFARTLRAA